MLLDKYPILIDNKHEVFEFLSEGPKGTIKKVVEFQQLNKNAYNLAFGDWNEVTQQLNDTVRSNNNDKDRILATVASTVIDFMAYHPNAIVFAQGNLPSKTRLYQIGITAHWQTINHLFSIQGFAEGSWHTFEAGKNYEAFALKAK